jgi:choline dehydrogenase-like flavoprotein
MEIHFELSTADLAEAEYGLQLLHTACDALGRPIPGFEPARTPNGTSLHLMGTVRMGMTEDGTSICDRYSRVWGFKNLFLASNGVNPMAMACNSTLTSVAFAAVSAPELVRTLE